MVNIVADSFADMYKKARPILLDAPVRSPRGKMTKEIAPMHFEIKNPRSRLGYHKNRKFNLMFAIAEACYLFSSSNKLGPLFFYNSKMRDYSDDGMSLYGDYGRRISGLMTSVIAKLQSDSESRQAILPISSARDCWAITSDLPCTIALQFMVREGKLDMHVYMRSNDFYWGTFYDVFSFTILQEIMANTLGCDVGGYYHSATSFHVYKPFFSIVESISELEEVEFSVPKDITLPYMFNLGAALGAVTDVTESIEVRESFAKQMIENGGFCLTEILGKHLLFVLKSQNQKLSNSSSWASKFLSWAEPEA